MIISIQAEKELLMGDNLSDVPKEQRGQWGWHGRTRGRVGRGKIREAAGEGHREYCEDSGIFFLLVT